ncbi:SAM-dependent methyltransferase [Campylobacter sp. MIT 99-7217]|uniref:Eco57I restriction-modification methylase domain-containing protein n=1 Tax=Campylobacter sp. MIT 99-7217 TaxID=535091 RepID=UPI001159417F|nr:methyltransferase [Campylobacter sp. MIT 99-7217]TQR32389.1 SAM-dependent methyltransferase [Campylobacter sp. MIT 99-7217]
MLNNFNEIKNYFDALNLDTNHFENSNDICTPMDCVKEMFDSLPEAFWDKKDLKILDSCCGNGNFHAYAVLKTELKNLYFNEINQKRIQNLKAYFGNDINLSVKDFLEFNEAPSYDLVVSNPPYAKFNQGKRVSKNHNLSRDFIKKALSLTKDGGYILFIVPNNWMSFADRNTLPQELCKYQFIVLDINGAKKYFPKVGSSFTWFLLQKIPNQKSFKVRNHYVFKDEQVVFLDKNINFIPLYYSNLVRSIINKTLNDKTLPKYKIQTSSNLHKYTQKAFLSPIKDEKFKYKIIHTPSQTVYSKKEHKYQNGYKVFISLTNQYESFIDECGMTQSIAFIRCKDLPEAKRIKEELDEPVYRFLNNITRYGNFNNVRILQNFPLRSSFSLSKEELSFIDKFNEVYYSGKSKK